MPSHRDSPSPSNAPGAAPPSPGEHTDVHEQGVDLQTPPQQERAAGTPAAPKLPHERDQSVTMTGGERHPEVEQAHRDMERGLQDTDRGPPADRTYRKLKDSE